jgi:hypothetical protein
MTRVRTLLLAVGCTAAGALGAGAIGSFAHGGRDGFHAARHHGFAGLYRAVHTEAVVPRRDNTFATITFDRGTVESVAGRDLTIREGTRDATYKTVTLTIPEDAKIHRRDADRDDTLSDLQAGDRVAVWQSSRKTIVLAKPKRG